MPLSQRFSGKTNSGGDNVSEYKHPDDTRSSKNYKPGPYGNKSEDNLSNKKAPTVFPAKDKIHTK